MVLTSNIHQPQPRIPSRFIAPILALIASLLPTSPAFASTITDEITVMSYNIWVGLNESNELQRQVDLITASGADIVGLQEQSGGAAAIADALGFHFHVLNGSAAVLSRFPITQTFADGVELDLGFGNAAFMFDVHLAAYPYQPYDIRDGLITREAEAIAQAEATRGPRITGVLDQMALALESGSPTFLVGDFNEPSHLDWTVQAAHAGVHAMKVSWPTSTTVVDAGLTDSFREIHPDPIARPADTWTPRPTADEIHDRIDRVYFAGDDITVTNTLLVGESGGPDVDLASDGTFPSDHRAVASTFILPFDVLINDPNMIGDINFDGEINAEDWLILSNNQHTDLSALSLSEAYLRGDLDGDRINGFTDFQLFKQAFDEAQGQGAFNAMLTPLPEPSSICLFLTGVGCALNRRRRNLADF